MAKKDILVEDIIDYVRRELPDSGARIESSPRPFRLAWWPEKQNYSDQWPLKLQSEDPVALKMLSDYGATSGPKELSDEFKAEVRAIHQSLDKLGHMPQLASWQKGRDQGSSFDKSARRMFASMDQRRTAENIWQNIAIPFRRRGDVLFRLSMPREILVGEPDLEVMPLDEFIRGVSSQTILDRQKLARLNKKLKLWRIVAAIVTVVALLLIARWWAQ